MTDWGILAIGLPALWLLTVILYAFRSQGKVTAKTNQQIANDSGRWRQFKQALTIQNFGYYFLILVLLMLMFAVGAYIWQGGGQ